jgi:hypothetical protein
MHARPAAVLVQMGLQPQDRAVPQLMLRFAQTAMQAFISLALLAMLVQWDAAHALRQIPKYVTGAMQVIFFQVRNARHAQPDVQHVQIPQCASAAVRATFFQMINARLV